MGHSHKGTFVYPPLWWDLEQAPWRRLLCLSFSHYLLLGGTPPPKLAALCLLKDHLSEKQSAILYWGGPQIGPLLTSPQKPCFLRTQIACQAARSFSASGDSSSCSGYLRIF